MVTLLEKEIKQADDKIQALVAELDMKTMDASTKMQQAKLERKILNKMLHEQKLRRTKRLFALENGLLLFAIGLFGLLAAFVMYLISGYSAATPTWEEVGSDMAVMLLLVVMTTVSTVLYVQHYRYKIKKK